MAARSEANTSAPQELCGAPVLDRVDGTMSTCGRLKGHKPRSDGKGPGHVSIAAVARKIGRNRERIANESPCSMRGCTRTAPKGAMQCPECRRSRRQAYYAEDAGYREREQERNRERRENPEYREREREQHRKRHGDRRAFWKDMTDAIKVHKGCEQCGFSSERPGFFDRDHIERSTKTATVASLAIRLTPGNPEHVERYRTELEKCQVLCVACHRGKTSRESRHAEETASRAYMRSRRKFWHDITDAVKVIRGCAACGFRSDRPGYFDLDHVERCTKVATVASLAVKLTPRNQEHVALFTAEALKCQVLCAACHRGKTALENLSQCWPYHPHSLA